MNNEGIEQREEQQTRLAVIAQAVDKSGHRADWQLVN
jgi:hypothetical protein